MTILCETELMGTCTPRLPVTSHTSRHSGQKDARLKTSLPLQGPDGQFVRVLLHNHRMIGAVLVGETGLEEAFENLILDGLDLSSYGPDILDPEIELDNIFD